MNPQDRLPYPGLRAFTQEESDLFFGREDSVDKMIDCLGGNRFMAVLGPSGSGKSSLVRTGLLDGLKLGFLSAAGSSWKIADMNPGGEPMRKFASALLAVGPTAPASDAELDFMTTFLRRGPRSVIEWANAGNIRPDTNLLLLVDQFEELFRYGDYEQREEAEAFVAALLESAATRDAAIYVVITMRSEYLGACASIPGLAERISNGMYLAPRMDRDQCREAIVGPAGVVGFDVQPALVNRLLNDLNNFAPFQDNRETDLASHLARQADQLPLMQHVLNRLWLRAHNADAGQRVALQQTEYEGIGGLSGALDAHGEEVTSFLGPQRQDVVEIVFRALVTGESVAAAVRRPCRMGELVQLAGGRRDDVVAVVQAFSATGCNFLRTSRPSLAADDTIVDISHESLIRQWTPLRLRLEKEIRDGSQWRRLLAAEERYRQGEGDLLRGLDYQSYAAWWEAAKPNADWAHRHGGNFVAVQSFMAASHDAEDLRLDADRRRQRAERNRLRAGIAALATVLVVVSALGIFSFFEMRSARRAKDAVNSSLAELNAKQNQLEKANEDLRATKAISDGTNLRLEDTQRGLQANEATLQNTIAALQAAKARGEETLKERDTALTNASTATASAERDAGKLTGALDQISGIINSPQYNRLLGAADFRADLMKAIQANEAYIEEQHRNMIGEAAIMGDDYRSSRAFSATGNVPQQLALLEKSYTAGLNAFRAFPAGQAMPEKFVSDCLDAGSDYIWLLFDLNENAKALAALHQLEIVEASFPSPKTADLTASIANFENVESRYYEDTGNSALGDQHSRKFLDLSVKAESMPDHDQNIDQMEAVAYLNTYVRTSVSDRLDLLSQGCQLTKDFYAAHPSNLRAIDNRVTCLSHEADEAHKDALVIEARNYVAQAEEIDSSALQYDPANQDLLLSLAQLENTQSNLETDEQQAAADSVKAKEYFVQAIKGRTVSQANPGVLSSIYNECRLIRFGDPKVGIQFYKDIIDSLSATVAAFPEAKTPAYIVGDASAHLGRLFAGNNITPAEAASLNSATVRGTDDLQAEAIHYMSQAIAWLEKSGLMKNISVEYDDFPDHCGYYVDRAKLYGETGKFDLMFADEAKMKAVCTPFLNKYSWDFNVRQQFITLAANSGAALADAERYKDALPYVQYASHWSDHDSSVLLAKFYTDGLAGAPNPTMAQSALDLAGKQELASFSEPVAQNGKSFTVQFSLRQWPDEYPYKGIDDQAKWYEATRSATVDPTAVLALEQCDKSARQSNMSVPKFCDETVNREVHLQQEQARLELQKRDAALQQASLLASQGKWHDVNKIMDGLLAADPGSIPLMQQEANLYHEVWFQFDRAYNIDQRRIEAGEPAATQDFAEANLTAAHYETCADLATALQHETQEQRMSIIMTALEFACWSGANQKDSAHASGVMLRSELSGLEKVNWDFSGTKHFVASQHPFDAQGPAWVSLFEALEAGDERKALTALTALGIPDPNVR
jgi:hypothetical protein